MAAGPGRLRPRTESDRGSTVAEAVIIVPVIIIVTLVVVQFVLLWHGRHVAQAAAQTAARAAATYQGSADVGRVDGDAYLAEVAPNTAPRAGRPGHQGRHHGDRHRPRRRADRHPVRPLHRR